MFYVLSGNDFLCGAATVVEKRIRWRSEGGHGGSKFHPFVTVCRSKPLRFTGLRFWHCRHIKLRPLCV